MAYARNSARYDSRKAIAALMEKTPKNEKELLIQARARFKLASDAEKNFREAALDDLKFLTGKQWPEETKRVRDATHRPCLTINRLPSIKKQIVNEQRAQRPAIVVKPVGNGADIDDAEMLSGLLRHIQVASDSEVAIDCAFEHMVTSGKGYVEIEKDYLPGSTFDQELYIRRIKNPFTIYCDPSSIEADESDAAWKFKICDYPFAEYKAQFGDTKLASLTNYQSIGDQMPGWGDSKTIRVAAYYHKEWNEEQLYRLSDNQIMTKTVYDLRFKRVDEKEQPEIIDEREWRKCRIVCSIINAIEIIDEYTFPGKVGFIPLIPCLGEDFDVNGERILNGIVRDAKDPQREINFFRSWAAETIMLAPKAPWTGWKGQFKDAKWKDSNLINFAYLESDYPVNAPPGAQVGLPQRNVVEPPIQGVLAMGQVVDGDLKAVTGIYEPSLGQTKTDQSGRAIDLLQKQGGLTNLNFTDNLSRTMRAIGRVLLDAAPFVYDSPRVQRIINPDGTADHVIIHSGRAQAAEQLKTPEIQDIYDLSQGVYDVVVDVGPSFKTKREEAFNMQLQLATADKTGEIMKVAGDIIIANSDMPGAQQIADRIKKTMPPNLISDDKTDPKVQLQQATATIQQLEKQNTELMKQNAQFIDTIKTEQVQQNVKIEVAKIQAAASVEVAGLSAKLDMAKLEFAKFELIHGSAHDRAMADSAAATQAASNGAGDTEGGETASPPPDNADTQGAQVNA